MKKLALASFLVFTALTVSAQKVYFVYLQSDSRQPFFLKMGGKVYNSSGGGYLILSKLRDSSYSFTVGFTGSNIPEQSFSVMVNKKDHGYLLKDFGSKGWGLFDLQTMEVIYSGTTAKVEDQKPENRDVSAFTEILSRAADDPSLKEKTVAAPKEEKKEVPVVIAPVTKATEEKTAVVIEEKKPVVNNEVKEVKTEPVLKEEPKEIVAEEYRPSEVKRRSESNTTEGIGLVYTDNLGNGNIDTIRLLIPEKKKIIEAPVKEEQKDEKKFLDIEPVKTEPVKTEPAKVEPIANEVVKTEIPVGDTVKKEAVKPAAEKVPVCKATASKDDFFKLRKEMASVASNEEMIDEAKKYFRNKCFSTQQLKNLGSLFLDEDGRYRFFDVAYNHVSDPANFPSLESELKDAYYINRFRAMLR